MMPPEMKGHFVMTQKQHIELHNMQASSISIFSWKAKQWQA